MIDLDQKKELIKQAYAAMELSYSPYSGNKVGAALLTKKGQIYIGANVGNSCSTLNCCAEQVALISAIMEKDMDFTAIAIVISKDDFAMPCGRCLQLLAEFADDMLILTTNGVEVIEHNLKYLLPLPYRRSERAPIS